MLLRERSQLPRAEERLLESTRKNVILDGIVAYYVMRPLSRLLTRPLLNTRVSQHVVTLCALAVGIAAGFCASRGQFIAAGIAYFMTGVLDCVDGDLARLRVNPSRFGSWLDSLTDEAVTLSLVVGIGLGLGDKYRLLAFCVAGAHVFTATILYLDLARKRLPIDTALYPWFFLGDVDPERAYPPRGFFGRIAFALGFLIRRDANVTIIAVLLALGRARIALAIVGAAVAAITLLLLVHIVVMLFRGLSSADTASPTRTKTASRR
jgi:phosphatidylglycerophosphate synthase